CSSDLSSSYSQRITCIGIQRKYIVSCGLNVNSVALCESLYPTCTWCVCVCVCLYAHRSVCACERERKRVEECFPYCMLSAISVKMWKLFSRHITQLMSVHDVICSPNWKQTDGEKDRGK